MYARARRLYKNVARMRRLQGAAFDFVPRFFILPSDYEDFKADYSRHPSRLYIRKVALLLFAAMTYHLLYLFRN